jgi:membrane-bound lytic murein transglycosylase B
MANVLKADELLKLAAEQHGVSPEILLALLELEGEFGNLTAPGAKGDFSREVARILDAASAGATV